LIGRVDRKDPCRSRQPKALKGDTVQDHAAPVIVPVKNLLAIENTEMEINDVNIEKFV
jgi:hypothetical protein